MVVLRLRGEHTANAQTPCWGFGASYMAGPSSAHAQKKLFARDPRQNRRLKLQHCCGFWWGRVSLSTVRGFMIIACIVEVK